MHSTMGCDRTYERTSTTLVFLTGHTSMLVIGINKKKKIANIVILLNKYMKKKNLMIIIKKIIKKNVQ